MKSISRRTVLRGAGTVIALPFLDAMVPAFTPQAKAAAIKDYLVQRPKVSVRIRGMSVDALVDSVAAER